jgi:hypothetical protein
MGLADLVLEPYKGAQEDGLAGFTKGFGRGLMSPFFKSGAGKFCPNSRVNGPRLRLTITGLLGLFAYPAQGIYKSLHSATHRDTRKHVMSARRVQDIHFARSEAVNVEEQQVLDTYAAWGPDKKSLSRITSPTATEASHEHNPL